MFLTTKKLRGLTAPGKYNDGHGLILHVVTAERRNWLLRYTRTGKERVMGLGSAAVVSLDEAREKAQAARKLLAEGIDPIDARHAAQAAAQAQQAARVSFAEAAALYIAAHEAGWRNPKHRQQWRNTLTTYAEPVIGAIPVADIDANMVLRVLMPIWTTKPETAIAGALADRDGARLRHRARLAHRHQPRHLARQSQADAARQGQGPRGEAPCGAGLARDARVHGGATRARRHGRQGAGVRHPDRRALAARCAGRGGARSTWTGRPGRSRRRA